MTRRSTPRLENSMFEKTFVAVVSLAAIYFFAAIMGPLFGGLAGWIVGFFFTDPILDFLRRFGVNTAGLTVWQIGAALGFIGGFFKATLSTSSK
jgi:predicted PurR-regulated permease PerM